MKRANGTGSIMKLSGNRRNKYGVYLSYRDEETDKVKQKFVQSFAKKQDAEKFLNNLNGVNADLINATVEYVYGKWLETKSGLSKSTIDCYKAAWLYFDEIKHKKIRSIKSEDFQSAVDKAVDKGRGKDTCKNIRIVAKGISQYAMQNDICNKDYSKFIKLPQAGKVNKKPFTDFEIKKLKDNQGDIWVDSILVMIYTGLRVSEMLGLTKFNIDLANRKITGAGLKTDAGKEREIPIHNYIYDILVNRMNTGKPYLFCATDKMLDKDHYRNRYFTPTMERLEMDHLPHECRHTMATSLVRQGVEPQLAKYILGHTQYSTTMDIYNHPQDKDLLKAINQI